MSTTVTLNIPLDGDELEAAAEMLTVMAEHHHRVEESGDVQLETDAQIAARPLQQPGVSGTVETDAHGIPWDTRIHAKTKSKAANGTWRKKRGVPDEVIATVEAEITTVTPPVVETPSAPAPAVVETPSAPATAPVVETPSAPAPAPASAPVVVETPSAPAPAVVETPLAPAPTVVETPSAPAPAPAPAVVETPSAPAPAVVETPSAPAPAVVETPVEAVGMIKTMAQLVERIKAENIQPPIVIAACQSVGIKSLPILGAQPDLIPQVATALGFV